MNFPGLIFFYFDGIEKIDRLKDRFEIMIAIRSSINYFQAQVYFGKRM
ncbi:MAG: hypothetical protein MUF15_20975 [Acidobacteria bacterium]|nr:hypothetical protein [Acidobacteriota bacterium]